MGTPEMLPRHKMTERTKTGREHNTNARAPLRGVEVHGHTRNTALSQDDRTYKEGVKNQE